MASGVTVATNVTNSIEEMRVLKENEERLRVLRFGFCDTATTKSGKKEEQIDVTERVTQKDLNEKNLDAFAYMQKEIFKDKTCAYVLYDCKYDAKETGSKAEMIFIMWCPGTSTIQEKMKYASSKDALKNKIKGIKHKVEVCDNSDVVTKKAFIEFLGRSDIVCLEGETV